MNGRGEGSDTEHEQEIDLLRNRIRDLTAERDGAQAQATAAKRDRDTARLQHRRLLDQIAEQLGLSSGLELAESPEQVGSVVRLRILAEREGCEHYLCSLCRDGVKLEAGGWTHFRQTTTDPIDGAPQGLRDDCGAAGLRLSRGRKP